MNDPDRTQNLPSQPNRSNATQNGAPTSTRARIDQIRDKINQLQEEKELELLILQLHDLEQELAHLRSRRRSLPNHASRYRTRSPFQRQSTALHAQARRSRSPDRMLSGPGLSSPRDPAAPAAAPGPIFADLGMSSSLDLSESSLASENHSQSTPPIKPEPADSNPAAAVPRPQPNLNLHPPGTDPNPNPVTEPVRPPAEWCRRCLRCMEKEPTIRCVLSPRSPRGKCIRCCTTHGTCEPIPQQCADLARDAVSASLDFCADRSPSRFDRLLSAVSAVRLEMRQYPTPETPKGSGGRLPASAAATPATPAIATVNGPPPTTAPANGPATPATPATPAIATVNGPAPTTAPSNGPAPPAPSAGAVSV